MTLVVWFWKRPVKKILPTLFSQSIRGTPGVMSVPFSNACYLGTRAGCLLLGPETNGHGTLVVTLIRSMHGDGVRMCRTRLGRKNIHTCLRPGHLVRPQRISPEVFCHIRFINLPTVDIFQKTNKRIPQMRAYLKARIRW